MTYHMDLEYGLFWFRIYGYGVSFENREKIGPSFSERQGLAIPYRLGKWAVNFLEAK